jgi:hypothetical protein
VRYRFVFRTRVGNKNSYLYAVPPVRSIDDPNLNVKQTYSSPACATRTASCARHARCCATSRSRPTTSGPRRCRTTTRGRAGDQVLPSGGKVFAGQVDDPFFVDLGTTFDALNIRKGTGNAGGGKDDLAATTSTRSLCQVPEAQVTVDGSRSRRRRRQRRGRRLVVDGASRGPGLRQEPRPSLRSGEVQVSRLGNRWSTRS